MNADTETAPQRGHRKRGILIFLRDVLVIVLIAAAVSFLIKTFLVRSFYIPSGSMENTLQVNDHILVDELTPRWSDYQRGEIIVFKDPGSWLSEPIAKPPRPGIVEIVDGVATFLGLSSADSQNHLVKRIIGVGGDRVVCCNALGQLTINGTAVDESAFVLLPEGDTLASSIEFDVTVPADSFWVMGDNRNRSQDSRYHQDAPGSGFVPYSSVVGKVFFRTWPLSQMGGFSSYPSVFGNIPDPEIDSDAGPNTYPVEDPQAAPTLGLLFPGRMSLTNGNGLSGIELTSIDLASG